MPMPLKLTQDQRTALNKSFGEYLDAYQPSQKFDFKANITVTAASTDKMHIVFSTIAKLKMQSLISNYTTEVGWNGTVTRIDKNHFVIEDIIVYPQKVTGATCTTEDYGEKSYSNFLMSQPDEIFDKLRFQGHSHVNMGTTPSGVDENFYDGILNQLKADDYYIFMICNKRGDVTARIYDLADNLVYNTNDCSIEVLLPNGINLTNWIEDSKKLVEDSFKAFNGPESAFATGYSSYSNGAGYTGYHESSYSASETLRGGFDPNEIDDPVDTGYKGYSRVEQSRPTGNNKITTLNTDTPRSRKDRKKDRANGSR